MTFWLTCIMFSVLLNLKKPMIIKIMPMIIPIPNQAERAKTNITEAPKMINPEVKNPPSLLSCTKLTTFLIPFLLTPNLITF